MNEPHFTPPATANFGTPELLIDSTEESVTTSSTIRKSGMSGRLAVGGLVAALAVGGLFASRSALTGPAGPASSDEAVTQFFAALDNDDMLGLAEVLHPAERQSIAQPIFDMVDHGKRLGVVSADTDLAKMSFIDFEVDGLTYSVEATSPRLHYVTTTGGTLSTPNDPTFPTGSLFERFDLNLGRGDSGVNSTDLGNEPMKMAVVEDDGSWYVSLWYSAAEDARRDAGKVFPGLGAGPAPVGSATPDAVLEDMMTATFDLDADGMLTLMDPEEAAALYDYSPLFMNTLQESLDEAKNQADAIGLDWNLDSIDFTAVEANGRQLVSFNSMKASFSIESESVSMGGSITTEGECAVITIDDDTVNTCDSQTDEQAEEFTRLRDELVGIADLSDLTMSAFDKLSAVERGVTVVERDGRWFLSVMPTMLETMNDHMAVLDPGDLVAMGTDIEELVDDQERVGEELIDLFLTIDVDAVGSDLGDVGDLGALLGTAGAGSFVPLPSGSTSVEESDWSMFDLGGIEEVLVPHESAFQVAQDETYISWQIDLADAPEYVNGAYLFDELETIEVAEFAAPVDPALLDSSSWSLEQVDDVVIAINIYSGERYAFVGNYVVWSTDGGAADGLFVSQVVALK
jgi:hypothetical protein